MLQQRFRKFGFSKKKICFKNMTKFTLKMKNGGDISKLETCSCNPPKFIRCALSNILHKITGVQLPSSAKKSTGSKYKYRRSWFFLTHVKP